MRQVMLEVKKFEMVDYLTSSAATRDSLENPINVSVAIKMLQRTSIMLT
jgi:hypothetical protein